MRTFQFVAFSMLSAGAAFGASTLYYLPEVVDGIVPNGSVRTTIVVANPGKTAANLIITATRDDGTARPLTIAGLGSNTRFTTRLGAGATRLFATDGSGDGSSGAAVVSSDAPVSVSQIVTYVDLAGNPLSESAVPALLDPDLALEFRVPADTTGALNTGVALYNPGAAAATVTLRLLNAAGSSVTLRLAPHGQVTRFVRDDLYPGVGDFQGTLDVTSTAAVAAVTVRRNTTAPFYSLVPAAPALSRRLRFLLPQVSDGVGPASTLQTTFLLTNLSTKPASVSLSLTQADGSPFTVTIPGLDDNSNFTAGIPVGASVFWQTDGSTATLTAGMAVIRSDQPLAAAAVITASDTQGVFLSETGVAPAPIDFQFVLPFDNSSNTVAGAALFNAGSRPVTLTLNLLDADGKAVSSATLDPLVSGASVRGAISDFFPAASAATGSVVATAAPGASIAAVGLRQATAVDAAFAAPAFRLPHVTAGTPAMVVSKPDNTHQASASIPPGGGTLSLTDAKGNRFTLTLPSGALLNRETITMTAISSATGISGPGLIAGVQLEPEGLALLAPGMLKIEVAAPLPAGAMPIGWRGQAPGVYLNPLLPDTKSFTLLLNHFSGAGAGGFDLTSELLSIADLMDFYQSLVAQDIAKARQQALSGDEEGSQETSMEINDLFSQWYSDVVEPMMELAQASDDEDVMRCAATVALGYARQASLMGGDESAEVAAVSDFASYIMQRALQKLLQRCQQHDFTVFYDLMSAARQLALTGGDGSAAADAAMSCPPQLDLTFTSEISGVIPVGVTGTFDSTIKAKTTLTGSFTKTMLSQIVDPSKDLLTSFTLTGSGPETYDSMSLIVNNVPAGCSVSVASKAPDVLTVKQGADPQLSQVQFKFNPNYQPQALTINGQQLCSFCPVYRKTPIKVEMWLDPGKPTETVLATCPSASTTIPGIWWYAGWSTNHATAGDNGFIKDWDMMADPSFSAQKNINEHVTGPSATLTEKTTLMLKPKTQ